MTCLAAKSGDSCGAWLFAGFGVLFGIPLLTLGIKVVAKRNAFFKAVDEGISGRPEPRTTFVPHWFIMTAILLTLLAIVLSILIKVFK
jgi:hypothetical protein